MGRFISLFIILFSLIFLFNLSFAQVGFQFGQNKVQYKDFDWEIFTTEHFNVHYYPEEKQAAYDAARMAERGYSYLSEVLDHKFKRRIPLILYASLNDFQQTNVVFGMIGDGTRGVTESLKNRVVLPITGSYREFNHVLVHELVHAFQFDIMSRVGEKSGVRRFNPPLWFVEGMAEYLSNTLDNTTRMWVRDGLYTDKLLTIDELNSTFDIRVYRLGQSVWYYIGETYGKKRVGEILKAAVRKGSIEMAVKSVVGLNDSSLTANWHSMMKDLVLNESLELQHGDSLGTKISKRENFIHRMNLIPTVSPNGKHVAYITNKNLRDEIYLLSKTEDGDYEEKQLIKGGASKSFESLRFFSSSMNWSRDGKLFTFVTKSGPDDALYVMNPHTEKITHKFIFDELNGLQSPSFSPDANKIAFVGMSGGQSDLYILDLKTERLTPLTMDRLAVLHPQWSPDGESIVFITDRGPGTNEDKLLFGDYDLALYDLSDDQIKVITNLSGDLINPQWTGDSQKIAFISDHQGIANIYQLNLKTNEIEQLTMLRNGVSGITHTTPAFSMTADGKEIVFSTFEKSSWQIFRMKTPEKVEEKPQLLASKDDNYFSQTSPDTHFVMSGGEDTSKTVANYLWLPPMPEPNNIYRQFALGEEDSIEQKDYSSKLRLDAVFAGANIGGFFGSAGGAQFLFSDMLGNQNLIVSTELRFNNPLHSDLGVTYFNQGNRLNYGVQLFQNSSAFGAFIAPTQIGFIRQTYRGANVFGIYPFSRFSRIELSAGATAVEQDLVVESFFNDDDSEEDLNTLKFGQAGAAYVYDNTNYGPLGPLSGNRYRLSVQNATGDLNFTTLFADYRKYFNINFRSVISWRIMGGSSNGDEAQIFRIGGPFTYRGSEFGDLIGTKFLVQNLEYRFPLLPFLSAKSDFLSGFAFADAAAAWGIDIPGFVTEDFQPFTTDGGFRLKDLNFATGVGARLAFGIFALQYHFAWPTDFQGFDKPINQFSIGTFF